MLALKVTGRWSQVLACCGWGIFQSNICHCGYG